MTLCEFRDAFRATTIEQLTLAATAEVVRYLGATPVFGDIDSRTFNIDTDKLAKRLERHKAEHASDASGAGAPHGPFR